jgi:EAL domain-containing protein (putative c-di-GMP-specific phosphodiesterase class I)
MATEHAQNGSPRRHNLDSTEALGRPGIEVQFQPKVDLRNGRVAGVEALHDTTLPTERVIEVSTRAAGDWWRSGLRLQLSVNLPSSALLNTEWTLDSFLSNSLSAAGLPGEALEFEVTGEALLTNPDLVAGRLERLVALGGVLSIDNFGTGHFSLPHLIRLPFGELKIDPSLIRDLDDEENRTLARASIHLAHQVGLPVVAEGVDSRDIWQQVRSMGCERAQGSLISRPLPAREIPAWLASWNQRARELSSTKSRKRRARPLLKRGKTPVEASI